MSDSEHPNRTMGAEKLELFRRLQRRQHQLLSEMRAAIDDRRHKLDGAAALGRVDELVRVLGQMLALMEEAADDDDWQPTDKPTREEWYGLMLSFQKQRDSMEGLARAIRRATNRR